MRLAVGWKIEVLENKKSGVICSFLHDLSQNKTKLYWLDENSSLKKSLLDVYVEEGR